MLITSVHFQGLVESMPGTSKAVTHITVCLIRYLSNPMSALWLEIDYDYVVIVFYSITASIVLDK